MQSAVDRLLRDEASPAGPPPPAPGHLDEPARAKWAEIAPTLQARGDVDQGTLDGLAAYCSAWSRWTAAEAKVGELGPVVKSPAGFPVANPYLAIAAAAQRQLRQWASELGLTPLARKRLKIDADAVEAPQTHDEAQ